MDIDLRNDRIPRNPFDHQFLDMRRIMHMPAKNKNTRGTNWYSGSAAGSIGVTRLADRQSIRIIQRACVHTSVYVRVTSFFFSDHD